ncbi:MAG: sugar phosphate isomerase/epimerase [Clostridia bacterium]|nr:sugar phosphate isomerase/epimerase [Clostridia bacterium]
MRFGVCASPDKLPLLAAAGYDYFEFKFSKLTAMSEDEFAALRRTVEASPLKAETYNGFFPSDMPLYVGCDLDRIAAYCELGFSRAEQLGGKIAVFGSGGARSFPEGYDPAEGAAQFLRVLRVCGDAAARHGMLIAIEPLRACECGYINTVAEGLAVCRAADHPAVRVLADFFHVYSSGESFAAIEAAGEMLIHVHLARPNDDRAVPTAADLDACRPWADLLRRIGYDARISLECSMKPDFETAITAVRPILNLFQA